MFACVHAGMCAGFRVQGLGLGVGCSVFGDVHMCAWVCVRARERTSEHAHPVWSLGFRIPGLGFRV